MRIRILFGTVIGFLALILFYTAYIYIKFRISPIEYMKRLLPTFLICLSSGSFGAAFTTAFNAVTGLDTDVSISSFTINIGSIAFKPAHSITFIVSSVVMARYYGVEISVAWLIFAVFLSIILTVAVPNIPGASAPVYALIYSQLGLPDNALALMISINAFLEFLMTAVNVYCLQSEIVIMARKKTDISM